MESGDQHIVQVVKRNGWTCAENQTFACSVGCRSWLEKSLIFGGYIRRAGGDGERRGCGSGSVDWRKDIAASRIRNTHGAAVLDHQAIRIARQLGANGCRRSYRVVGRRLARAPIRARNGVLHATSSRRTSGRFVGRPMMDGVQYLVAPDWREAQSDEMFGGHVRDMGPEHLEASIADAAHARSMARDAQRICIRWRWCLADAGGSARRYAAGS